MGFSINIMGLPHQSPILKLGKVLVCTKRYFSVPLFEVPSLGALEKTNLKKKLQRRFYTFALPCLVGSTHYTGTLYVFQ